MRAVGAAGLRGTTFVGAPGIEQRAHEALYLATVILRQLTVLMRNNRLKGPVVHDIGCRGSAAMWRVEGPYGAPSEAERIGGSPVASQFSVTPRYSAALTRFTPLIVLLSPDSHPLTEALEILQARANPAGLDPGLSSRAFLTRSFSARIPLA